MGQCKTWIGLHCDTGLSTVWREDGVSTDFTEHKDILGSRLSRRQATVTNTSLLTVVAECY